MRTLKKSIPVLALSAGVALGLNPAWQLVVSPVLAEEEHGEHGEHEQHDGGVVRLDPQTLREFGVEISEAGAGDLAVYRRLPGEVVIDPDRLVHVVPRVSGVAQKVHKKLGDRVRAGDVLAVLESRELAELKSAYLVARERARLAQVTFKREERLWQETISSEREYLTAKQNLAELRIEMRAAEQKLHALGFVQSYVETLSFAADEYFTRYEIRAPFDGTVIEKHLADLSAVQLGQTVQIAAGDSSAVAGIISYISPVVHEETRTAVARVVLDNGAGQWRPGSFVMGLVAVAVHSVPLLVPRSALQMVDGQPVVFVETAEGFAPREVRVGRSNEVDAEIVDGLTPGQHYVVRGAFTLKAQLAKGSFGDGHSH